MFFFTYQVSLMVNNHTHLQLQPGDKITQASKIALIISTAISTAQIPNPFQHLVLSFKVARLDFLGLIPPRFEH